MRKNIINRTIVAIVAAVMLFTAVPINVSAATYSVNGQTWDLTFPNDAATLTINGGQPKTLTSAMVAADGVVDPSTGTAYVLWTVGAVYWYNGADGFAPHKLCSGVTMIQSNANTNFIGFYNNGKFVSSALTAQQIQSAIAGSGSSNNGNGNGNGNNTSNDIYLKPNGQNAYLQNNSAIVDITENGNTKKIVLTTSKIIMTVIEDYNGTVYVIYTDTSMYAWNHSLQGYSTNMIKVADRTGDIISTNGKMVGYYLANNSTFQPAWSLDQLRAAINNQLVTNPNPSTNPGNNSTNTTDPNYKKFYCGYSEGTKYTVYDSNDNAIDSLTLTKAKVLKVKGWKLKGTKKNPISIAKITIHGDYIYRYKNGSSYLIDRDSFERTYLGKLKGFKYTRGLVSGYRLKSGEIIFL